MKKLINDPRNLVREVLESVVSTSRGVALLEHENVVVQNVPARREGRPVAVLSGGGSGHEPGHAGYVGHGMLSGAIAGDVFTSPSVDAVLNAIRAVGGPAGALLIVKNYTGDRLNFGLAAELATGEGIPTRVVLVGDDVSLHQTVSIDHRRGIAGTILVHKIAGATAAAGGSLDEVVAAAQAAAHSVGTMGVALGPCTLPSVGKPGFILGDDEIELGLGIHGEQGVQRMKLQPADALVRTIVETIISDRKFAAGTRVAILVNGLGATPPIELAVVSRAALAIAREHGLVVERLYTGVFLSALDMPGASVSLIEVNDQTLSRLDAPTSAKGWTDDGYVAEKVTILPAPAPAAAATEAVDGPQSAAMRAVAAAIAAKLIASEDFLAETDSKTGDGDLGASMVRGAEALKSLPDAAFNTPSDFLAALSEALRRQIAGSSGPFYAVGLARAARRLSGNANPDAADWRGAFLDAIAAVTELGGAQPGDRTMVDALAPAAAALGGEDRASMIKAMAAAAASGAEATAAMAPKLGRASYLGERTLGHPDAGAVAVSIWLGALAEVLTEQ